MTIKEQVEKLKKHIKELKNSCTHQNVDVSYITDKDCYTDYWEGVTTMHTDTIITCQECGKKWKTVGKLGKEKAYRFVQYKRTA